MERGTKGWRERTRSRAAWRVAREMNGHRARPPTEQPTDRPTSTIQSGVYPRTVVAFASAPPCSSSTFETCREAVGRILTETISSRCPARLSSLLVPAGLVTAGRGSDSHRDVAARAREVERAPEPLVLCRARRAGERAAKGARIVAPLAVQRRPSLLLRSHVVTRDDSSSP